MLEIILKKLNFKRQNQVKDSKFPSKKQDYLILI